MKTKKNIKINRKYGYCNLSDKELAKSMEIPIKQVSDSLKNLEKLGFIAIEYNYEDYNILDKKGNPKTIKRAIQAQSRPEVAAIVYKLIQKTM